jgi:subtilisin family serine protease
MRTLVALTILTFSTLSLPAADVDLAWRDKVDPWVLDTARSAGETECLVFLEEQADVTAAKALGSKDAKGRYVFETLTEVARRTQAPLIAELEQAGVDHRPFWIANMIWVRGDLDRVRSLAERPDVARIHANPRVALRLPPTDATRRVDAPQGVEPNIALVGVPDVFWSAGVTGQGVVVAGQDTGYEWDHPALKSHYRGWDGATADHNYNWHDAIHSGGGVCGPDTPAPCDDNNHGTHTMGTMVGDDGAGNQIGMAPGARWIGCRNMDQGVGTPATYSECFQFFVAPTDLNDENPDPSMAPDVINDSWICPPSEGCVDPNALLAVVENARAAGITVVASAGNSGSSCGTVESPPAIYDAAFSVGAINLFGEISSFSSRGPVTVDGSSRLKPDVAAPGENIRSSVRGGGYASFSGTSMSGPHVAGLVALILSAQGCFEGDVDAIETFIRQGAFPRTSSQNCGGIPGTRIPNNTFGRGTIRAVLPDAAQCSITLAGATVGVDAAVAVCTNQATAETVVVPLDADAFDCEAAGLAVTPLDQVAIRIRGTADGARVGSSVARIAPGRVACRNLTTGQSVPIPNRNDWDCTAAGLVADPGDTVLQVIRGRVD